MTERRCGTCRWWDVKELRGFADRFFANCNAPIPQSVYAEYSGDLSQDPMYHDQGTDCPAWQKREDVRDD